MKLIFRVFKRAENSRYPVEVKPKSEKINPVRSPVTIDPNPNKKIINMGKANMLFPTTRILKKLIAVKILMIDKPRIDI